MRNSVSHGPLSNGGRPSASYGIERNPMNSHHLVTVWNPSYATDPLEAHLQLLLDWDARATSGEVNDDDVYVWWGKVRSGQRQQPMPHLSDVLAMARTIDPDTDRETHLYLTDYRSLYVADVGLITDVDPRPTDMRHVPTYYTANGLHCDCWFYLRDIRLLVRDDLEEVTNELKRLQNVRYGDRPVSIYGGMVDLPLMVLRPDGRMFFGEGERDRLADGALWARFDAQRGGVGALEATLRDDHFGSRVWGALDVTARYFIASGERLLREHRRDRGADLSQVLVSYAKAVEIQANLILRDAMRSAPDAARRVKLHDATRLLPEALPLTLGQIAFALGGEQELGRHLRAVLEQGGWFTAEFAAIVDDFASARNASAHGDVISRESVVRWRDRLLGVGGESVIGKLATVRLKGAK